MALPSWLQTITGTSFVVILAFVGTIITVTWTNSATSGRLQRQLLEDRRRGKATRLFESRRDVYLERPKRKSMNVKKIAPFPIPVIPSDGGHAMSIV